MRLVLLPALLGAAHAAQPEPRAIVRRSLEADEQVWERTRDYRFLQRVRTQDLDGDGNVESTETKTWDVTTLEGSPYRRLVERDDKPLPPEEAQLEEEKLRHNIELRRKETAQERAKRIEEYQKQSDRNRAAVREIPDAFDFRLLGEERIDARQTWVIEGTPRQGYHPRDRRAKLFTQLRGRIWIDQATYQWVRAEAELLDTVTFGWILVRIGKGARVRIEQTHVDDEVWLPNRIWFNVAVRVGLVKNIRMEQETTFREYRRFKRDARAAAAAPVQVRPNRN